ncbi:MAG TPA: AbgT family transporter [Candidatus Fimivivens faecavium]|nr:AbgT family transporter [Candidatus Fimivivens faecavium]
MVITVKKDRSQNPKNSLFGRFLNGVELVGNRLPHPITLFALFSLAIVLISAVLAMFGVSANGELINRDTMTVEHQTVEVVSLLSKPGLVFMLTNAVKNFTDFAPLGIVLVAMLGVGVAEGSGYISAALRSIVAVTPRQIISPVVVFLGVMSNIASDAGYVVLVPIGALMFMAYGRHPIAGLAAAFAGVSGGFSANLLIGTLDPMLAGISTEAAGIVDPGYLVTPTANMFFMMVSTFLITILGTIVTDRIVEPRLGAYHGNGEHHDAHFANLEPQEKKALRYANITLLAMAAGILLLLIPRNSFLRNPETGSLISGAPFMDGFIILIALFFFIPSVVFGVVSGAYRSEKDVCSQLQDNMASMGGYIALVFVAAQFISYFNYTNLGTVLALSGANFLKASGISGPVLMVLFILFTGFVNLFMGSASAKWTIMAPVFVPMFMLLGYSPELTQVAYRIGDSCTNVISPLMSYFAMIVVFAKKYDEQSGIGTLVATMLPYSLVFLVGWSVMLIVWMLAGLPLGPGAVLFLS